MKPRKPIPPQLPKRILLSFLRDDLAEEVTGDLEEKFYKTVKTKSALNAKLNYCYQAMHYVRPFAIRRSKSYHSNRSGMFRNNVRIAARNLWNDKAYSFINSFGLTIGFTSCLLIGLYIQYELSFDKFQEKGDRIARVIMEYSFNGSSEPKRGNFTSTKVAPVFVRTFPEIESAVRMTDRDVIVKHHDNFISEPNFMYADSTFFDVFTFSFLEGNSEQALEGPNKAVLTESTSKKYFGNESPIGKFLVLVGDDTPYQITGVINDYPGNSQIEFDFIASFSSLGMNQEQTYFDANYTTYILLNEADALNTLQGKVTEFMRREMAGSGASINYLLESFPDIHLYSPYDAFVPNNSITYLYILAGVASLILMIVSFTYINLSTAKSIERAKEVGIRKVIGAARVQLFSRFIIEACILSVVSMILSIIIGALLLPYFNQLADRQLLLKDIYSPSFIWFAISVTICISMLAGSYPAVVLSGLKPVAVLKGVFKNSSSGKWVQQSLIVFQFAISALLIVSTIVVQKQLHFIKNKKLGFDREHLLVLPNNQSLLADISSIKQRLKTIPHVVNVSAAHSTPVKIAGGYVMRSEAMSENEQIGVAGNPIDENYIKTTGLEIIAGEDLTEQDLRDVAHKNHAERTYHFILNESATRQMGWTPESAIDRKMFIGHRAGTVKGVVKDFHFESMHSVVKPLVLFTELRASHILIKVDGFNLPETISRIESEWKQLVPSVPFEYKFLDDEYNKLYQSEHRLGIIMNLFAMIAIVLACMGLFGLSSFITQQRMKEIAIRKVLGASVLNIVNLLSGKFTRLVLVALLLACPAAYFLMSSWLQEFAYRIDLSWWIFSSVGLVSIVIALLTVSIQSLRAAVANPVESMKSE